MNNEEWNGKGLPPISCVCEVNHGGEWVSSEVIRVHPIDSCVAVMFLDSKYLRWVSSAGIRPLKTQEEKDREAFIKDVDLIAREARVDTSDAAMLDFYDLLFKAGFTAPKEEK